MKTLSLDRIWQILDEISDPEIPAVSIVELGMIRSVGQEGEKVTVLMSPTFIGCPALDVIQGNIRDQLSQAGVQEVLVKVTMRPPWSTDWITTEGRQKLKEFGLSPPPMHGGQLEQALEQAGTCPYCGSNDTVMKNSFGPTLCRAIYTCNFCRQPFEQFKPI